jgi:chromosome segregation ATPase
LRLKNANKHGMMKGLSDAVGFRPGKKSIMGLMTVGPEARGSFTLNDVPSHFVTYCPHCSTGLRVRSVYKGQAVRCKQCNDKFRAIEADEPHSTNSKVSEAVRLAQAPSEEALARLQALQAQSDRLSAENQQLKTRKQELKAELHSFRVAHEQLAAENKRLSERKQQLKIRKQGLKAELQCCKDAHEQLLSQNRIDRSDLDRIQAAHDRLIELLDRATADLEGIRAELGDVTPAEVRTLAEERASLRSEVERLGGEIQRLHDKQSEQDRAAVQLEQSDADLNAALAEVDRFACLLKARDEGLETARSDLRRLGVDRQKALDEVERLRSTLAEREETGRDEASRLRIESDQLRSERDSLHRAIDQAEQANRDERTRLEQQLEQTQKQYKDIEALRGEGERLRTEREHHRAESDRLRGEVEELRRALDHVERTHRDEHARREAQLQETQVQSKDIEALRGESDRLRTEREHHRAESDRLRCEVEELRRALDHVERTHRDEHARLHVELAVFAKKHDRIQHDESIRLLVERQEPHEELVEGLAQLISAEQTPIDAPQSRPRFTFQSSESFPSSPQTAGQADPPEFEPTPPADPHLTADDELQSARAHVKELIRQLAQSEKRQHEMASMLKGMGVQFSAGRFKNR